MGTGKRKANGQSRNPRKSYSEYGLDKFRMRDLQNRCGTGSYTAETLRKACAGFEWLMPWILLSVTKSKSYDALKVKWELKEIEQMPCCRTDFYGFRRKFYHNLDVILQQSGGKTNEIKG